MFNGITIYCIIRNQPSRLTLQNIVVYFGASRDFYTESCLEFNSLYLKREEKL